MTEMDKVSMTEMRKKWPDALKKSHYQFKSL